MRRNPLLAAVLVAAAVVLAASWFGFSGRQGLTPVQPASPGTEGIDQIYLFIGVCAVVVFLAVMIPLALILARYREQAQPREVEGPQIRGNTKLELTWTVLPTLIVVAIIGFTLYKAGGIREPARAAGERADVQIRVEGRQFYWRYVYENGAIAIDRLRVPVDRVVELDVTAPGADVVHSFWAPALTGKVDAIPGVVNHLRFRADRTGVFEGKCAELCGIQHGAMLLSVEVLPAAEFDRWVERTRTEQEGRPSRQLGEAQWAGVCSKCHFSAPEYAPNLIGNPLLGNREAVTDIVRNGRGLMPAVGRGWTEDEMRALLAYVRQFAPQEEGDGS